MNRLDVEFLSGGVTCRAWLYLPEADTPPPVIVMAAGFAGTRGNFLPDFAERFCAAGYAILLFDYRHFGASDGLPRQLLDIKLQLQDYAAAVSFARRRPDVDGRRLILWGSSFSGGHVMATAARDGGVTAVIAQNSFADGLQSMARMKPRPSLRTNLRVIADVISARLGRDPVMIAVAGPDGADAMFASTDAWELVHSMKTEDPLVNEVPGRIAMQTMSYRPGRGLASVRCPVLLCVCESDKVCPPDVTIACGQKAPQGEVVTYPCGHFDIYTGEHFERAVSDQVAFLRRHVPVSSAAA
ncbi:alpha/beta fold hydrolase [Streptomyces sp. Li-HN-5-11]|uniref:alpha/beta hydrolase n=1 Tax=Streptomyces sp. Li-HN-5-11 TaxID=3075432 RepID=UPI0028B12CCD|nr:alpha/beta fold hydrolase [Streptomyces sp. Li-HN-5-11]WNM31940.1 alpha/beta fold hydrolase [Streptomyces sp. Li-HN-5-11]